LLGCEDIFRQKYYTGVLKYLTPNSFTICTSDTLHLDGPIEEDETDGCDLQYARAWREMPTGCWWKNPKGKITT
jgi:hypothetical protein